MAGMLIETLQTHAADATATANNSKKLEDKVIDITAQISKGLIEDEGLVEDAREGYAHVSPDLGETQEAD